MYNSILSYLEYTADRFPDKVAVVEGENSITFNELRKRAQAVAASISKQLSDTVHSPVFVFLPRGIECIVAFLGIVYSGNIYCPTDVDYPEEKMKSILSQLAPGLIISKEKYKEIIGNIAGDTDQIYLEDIDWTDSYSAQDIIVDTDILYIIFTSGSTGIPKGVGVTHRGVLDYIEWASETFEFDETLKILNQAPFYFDNSTLDIYIMLKHGAELHIVPKSFYVWPAKLIQYIKEKSISFLFWVPSILINIANVGLLDEVTINSLRFVIFAGEVMPNKQLNYWRLKIPDAVYANLYGPTEITVDCTYYIVEREFEDDDPLPIGIPCKNSDVLILDENRQLITDSDKIGELCVRGSSLASGYWNNPAKTDEVFIQNPLNPHYRELIYCTGDLVYYNERHEIMYSGRKDYQIKHAGHRIELGEIETATLGLDRIENVCAIYDSERKQIVLFYQGSAQDREIQKYLVEHIPKYMVPERYVKLDRFPYNDNGKIDRKKLTADYITN